MAVFLNINEFWNFYFIIQILILHFVSSQINTCLAAAMERAQWGVQGNLPRVFVPIGSGGKKLAKVQEIKVTITSYRLWFYCMCHAEYQNVRHLSQPSCLKEMDSFFRRLTKVEETNSFWFWFNQQFFLMKIYWALTSCQALFCVFYMYGWMSLILDILWDGC